MAGPLQSPLRIINILVVHLLLADFCRGQFQLTGPLQPIVATLGDDIILPCHLVPGADVAGKTLEWTRPELDPRYVFVWRAGQDHVNLKNPSYKGRTSLYTGELQHGNISLKLSNVKPSDRGRYKCYVPDLNTESFVELVVGSRVDSWPTISLSGLDRNRGGVVLQCESTGWYPEPEVFWLDGEGNLLSAGPTETVRGPDDLYTVSSRVTVEKRHSNSFTCRVQQNSTNQIREAKIHVPDDFFEVQSSSSSTTVGLAVSLAVCILIILILGFFVWKFKTKRSSKHPETQVDGVTEEQKEGQQLMTHETVQMKDLNKGRGERKTENSKWPLVTRKRFKEEKNMLKEEKKRREEAEEEVQRKNQELQEKTDQFTEEKKTLQDKIQEFNGKQAEVQQLQEQIEKMETDLQTLMEDLQSDTLEDLKKPVPSSKSTISRFHSSQSVPVQSSSSLLKWPEVLRQFQEKLQKKITEFKEEEEKREKEVTKLQTEIGNKDETIKKLQQEKQDKETEITEEKKTWQNQLQAKIQVLDGLKDEVNKLTEEKKRSEKELQTKITEWEKNFKEEEKKRERAEEQVKKLQTELQEKKRREGEVQRKNQELQEKTDQFTEEKKKLQDKIQELEKQLQDEKKSGSSLSSQVVSLTADNNKLTEEKTKSETKITEWEKKFEEEEKKREKEVKELNIKFNGKQAEVQQLQEQIEKMETDLQTLMKDLQSDTLEDLEKHIPSSKSTTSRYHRSQSVPVQSSNSLLKWPEVLRQFQEKLQKKITEWEKKVKEEKEKREKEVKELQTELEKQLSEKMKREEGEKGPEEAAGEQVTAPGGEDNSRRSSGSSV